VDLIDDMPIKAIAPWFGGKRTLAPRITAELGAHRAYWEPFCGSMAVERDQDESFFKESICK
jgi:DNA adenine methylase